MNKRRASHPRRSTDWQVRVEWQLDRIRQAVEFIAFVIFVGLVIGIAAAVTSAGSGRGY